MTIQIVKYVTIHYRIVIASVLIVVSGTNANVHYLMLQLVDKIRIFHKRRLSFNLFDVLINDIFVIFIIVTKEYKCPECGEDVELDKFNDHVKNRHKGHVP